MYDENVQRQRLFHI